MTGDTCQPVSVSRTIEVPAEKLFDFLAHPANHPLIDGSGTLREGSGGVISGVGDVFTMKMCNDEMGDYEISNHVVEYEPGLVGDVLGGQAERVPGRVSIDAAVIVGLKVVLRRACCQHPRLGRLQVIDVEVQVHLHRRGRAGPRRRSVARCGLEVVRRGSRA